MVYFTVLLLMLVMVYRYDYQKQQRGKWAWYYFIMISLVCIAGFRYNLGIDTLRYQRYYESYIVPINQLNLSDFSDVRYQPLYIVLCSICKTITTEFWFFQLVHALLVNGVLFWFFKKYTKYPFVAICLYGLSVYLGYSMETMRASCAVAMMLLGYDQFKEGHKIGALVYFIASFFFHVQAIILIPLYVYLLIADNKIKLGRGIIVATILMLILTPVISYLIRENIYALAIVARMGNTLDNYSIEDFETGLNWKGMIMGIATTLLIPVLSFFTLSKEKAKYSHDAIMLFTLFVYLLCIPISIFYRFKEFFTPFMIVLLADTFGQGKLYLTEHAVVRLKSLGLKLLIIVFPYFWTGVIGKLPPLPEVGVPGYWEYYPYSSIFDKTDYPERDKILNYYIEDYY